MIEKVGWEPTNGSNITALPTPIPGEGQRQSLLVSMSPAPTVTPATKLEFYVWLRGDKEPRTATLKPPISAPGGSF